ncbi:hypothetical protein [Plantactinospora sp. B5E13]|uniref:hypothetical protein n=1 Tax=Plantactinospora sp. B5E13 TaxID=3153758 RepID=UPI00325D9ADC
MTSPSRLDGPGGSSTGAGGGRFDTGRDDYAAMKEYAKRWPHRIRALEGCQGISRHIANRLLADGEQVVDVHRSCPPGAGMFATG